MASQSLRLLVVEDDIDTASLIQETLRDHFGPGCVRHCSSLEEVRAVDFAAVDMVLSDMNLPDGSGLDVLDHVLKQRNDLPVILVTGEGIIENAAKAIRNGAYDYIVKAGDYLFAIPLMVEKNMAIYRTRQENQRLEQKLKETVQQLQAMAATDPLTGLANRRAFGQAMARCFSEAVRYNHDLVCIMIDLDGFKMLNDTLGHQRGDELLENAARVLSANCRASDIAGRFGGDEFIFLLPQTDEATGRQVAQRISDDFKTVTATLLGNTPLAGRLTMSMGLAGLQTTRAATPEAMVACADHALYRAKQSGRARLVSYTREPNAAAPTEIIPTVPGAA